MTTTHTSIRDQPARTAAALSHPGLIRLITEIDDHGPVPNTLARVFPDLPRHQIRHARDTARDLGLIDTDHHTYRLTDRGTALADLYDQAARWARAHDHPARDSSFVTRVQATFDHLTRAARNGETAASGTGHLLDALLGLSGTTPAVAYRPLSEAA
ncbi:hypothetical protein GCM10010232_49850 [Streptomyces amakusaensis]|uniref:Uncharacterized protein n=1 Tax=Streptomyces amakusaensis TaxID=67271 RepID=A0ABW0ANG4_9ACTN